MLLVRDFEFNNHYTREFIHNWLNSMKQFNNYFSAFIFISITFMLSNSNAIAQAPDFKGLGFGVGLSLTIDAGQNERINAASVVDGIVRIDDEDDATANVMLESHYFFKTPSKKNDKKVLWGLLDESKFGHGPFVAVRPGDEDIIDAIALGWMIGLKRDEEATSTGSWNLGLGFIVDPNVQILGDGIEANKPLPGMETEVRFKEKTQGGLLIMTSFSW